MAVSGSGVFCVTIRDIFDASQLPVNFGSDTLKVAMFTNTITPNFSTDTSYGVSPYNANEVTDATSVYTSGGATLSTVTFTVSSGSLVFDADDISWASSSIQNARCAVCYDDTVTTPTADPLLWLVDFGASHSTTNGNFSLQWPTAGIWSWDLTP